jgi:tetratricopeptide (TPR) repeat protein
MWSLVTTHVRSQRTNTGVSALAFRCSIVVLYASNLGEILLATGDLEGAQKQATRALRIGVRVLGPENPDVALYANNLGQILLAKGDLEEAERQTERALAIFEKCYGSNNPKTQTARCNLDAIRARLPK